MAKGMPTDSGFFMAADRVLNRAKARRAKFRVADVAQQWDEEVGNLMLPRLDKAMQGYEVGKLVRWAVMQYIGIKLHSLKHRSGMRLFLCMDYFSKGEKHPCELRNGHGADATGRKRRCTCNDPFWQSTLYMTRAEFIAVRDAQRQTHKHQEVRLNVLDYIIAHLHGAQTFADIEDSATEKIQKLLAE
jgi:hypothetical protein